MTPSTEARPGRNQPCYCGSGKKYKQCCLAKDEEAAAAARAKAAEEAAETPEATEPDAQSDGETAGASRTARPRTHQPWKSTATRGHVPAQRLPRKVGGS